MIYKVLILNNDRVKIDKDAIETFFQKKTPLRIDIEERQVSIKDLSYKLFAGGYHGLEKGVKDKLRPMVKEGEYHVVVFAYNRFKVSGYYKVRNKLASWTYTKSFYPETEHIELADGKHILHELMHTLCKRAGRHGGTTVDQMDRTLVNGIRVPYYKNYDPYAVDGNFAMTLKSFDNGNWEKAIAWWYNKRTWKYFKEHEVKGLKEDFVDKLDIAREYAGIPFVITSGLRSKAYNKKIGGSPTSAHLNGTGVDLRARNSTEFFNIVRGVMESSIIGITVYVKSKHVHLDMKSTRLEVLNK